ncbi:MAG: VanW family protein [Clostridia bacterium]|nr:VanW family protein [Clostridia bacterium]
MPEGFVPAEEDRRKGMFPVWTIFVLILCVAVWGFGFRIYREQEQSYAAYQSESRAAFDAQNVYLNGITVDGIHLGGMTREAASALFTDRQMEQSDAFSLIIQSGERKWRITSQEVPLVFDAETVLDSAFVPGHYGTLEERLSDIEKASSGQFTYETSYEYDRSKLSELVDIIGESLDTAPGNATLDAFNMETQTFSFKEGTSGVRADREQLARDILSALDAGRTDQVISVKTEMIEPELHARDLEGHFGLVSTFTTETTRDRDRNKNIEISAGTLNGQVVQPGATLSFNGCTGKRTEEKGYREAHAIVGGVLVDDTGGGVCQTSSTLFNAVVRADVEIVKRYAHSWPSIYVPRGEDATVNWPNRDFVFKNSSNYPIFLRAWYDNYHVTVEVYGLIPQEFARIDLESETIQTIKPSNDVLYTLDESLPLGTRQSGHSKRTGYVVDTYKVYYDVDGNILKREKLWRTNYPATQQEILYH